MRTPRRRLWVRAAFESSAMKIWTPGFSANSQDACATSFNRCSWRADIAKQGDSSAAVGHHIIYYNTQKKWAPVETLMITHVTDTWMLEKVRSLLRTFDMGICMSRETVDKLVWEGLPREKLCYVSPALDG